MKITKGKYEKKLNIKFLYKGLFYNNLYGMAIEGLIEFLISSYLDLKTL